MLNILNRTIFTGDNLPILRGINSESVDLIYLDPPFNKKKQFSAPIGGRAAGAAFKDTWTYADTDAEWWGEISDRHPALYSVIHAAGEIGGKADRAYLIYMAVRLLELRRILKATGSIYLHCDPTMSHALKMTMDSIFGAKNLRNEIVWHYRTYQGQASSCYPKKHDVLFWFSRDAAAAPAFALEYQDNYADTVDYKRWQKYFVRGNEIVYGKHPQNDSRFLAYLRKWITDHGRRPAAGETIYRCRGYVVDDVWTDVPAIDPKDKREKLGYPTQKPLALLSRVVRASSGEGDVVLDPFCGCATACEAAEMLGRRWIGIDIAPKAAELIRFRLSRRAQMETGAEAQKTIATVIPKLIARTDIPVRTDIKAAPKTRDFKRVLYGTQEGHCAGCREHFQIRQMEVDHIVPRAVGGGDNPENLQLLCAHCNGLKGDGTMARPRVRLKEYRAA